MEGQGWLPILESASSFPPRASPHKSGVTKSLLIIQKLIKRMSSLEKLTRIAEFMKSEAETKTVLDFAKKKYVVNQKDFKKVNPSLIIQLVAFQSALSYAPSQPCPSSQTHLPHYHQTFWHPTEFKIFTWISVCFAYITNRNIQQFNQEDLEIFQKAFPFKDPLFLEYNLKCLLKQERSSKGDWKEEEISLLLSIANQEHMKSKWSDISFSLFVLSDRRFFRSSHKCREKWYNHLDPSVRREKWTIQEDLQLFELIAHNGQRWAAISKAMSGARTEHMVKNRFKSIYKRYASRFQRSSFNKIKEMIVKDLNKKLNAQIMQMIDQKSLTVKTEEPSGQQKLQEPQKSTVVFKEEPSQTQQRCFKEMESLAQIWQSEEYEVGWLLQSSQCFQPIVMKEKIELIDYCMLELQHCQ